MRRRINAGSDDAKERVAGGRQVVVVDDVAGTDQLDAGFVETAFGELPGKGAGLSRCKSRARCRNGEKSGLASGTFSVSRTRPPPLVKLASKTLPASAPGAQSDNTDTAFLLPFLIAQSAMIPDCWPSVQLVRT